MIRLKTSVLLACATKMGAILADASDEDAEKLYKFGEKIGLAFQLQDDFLDVYGDTKVFGKAIGGDIISNKKTYMLINAIEKASKQQRETLEYWINMPEPDPQEKVAAVTEIYNEIGINQLALSKIDELFQEGLRWLNEVGVPEHNKQEMLAFTKEMMKRES